MSDTPLQSIQKLQTDVALFSAVMHGAATDPAVDFGDGLPPVPTLRNTLTGVEGGFGEQLDSLTSMVMAIVSGMTSAQFYYPTKTAMDADHTRADKSIGCVFDDGNNTGLYFYTAGTTTWTSLPDRNSSEIASVLPLAALVDYLTAESAGDWLFKVRDSNKRVGLGIDLNSKLQIFTETLFNVSAKFMVPPSFEGGFTWGDATYVPKIGFNKSGWVEQRLDSAGRRYFGIKTSGGSFGSPYQTATVALSDGSRVYAEPDADALFQIYYENVHGIRTKLSTGPGNNFAPSLTHDEANVLFVSDREKGPPGGRFYAPLTGGEHADTPYKFICFIGDSLTDGTGATSIDTHYPTLLSRALGGVPFDAHGFGGQTSTEGVARINAIPTTVTVATNTIPASGGTVSITAISVTLLRTSGNAARSSPCTIHGTGTAAHGTLSVDTSANYTFTRDVDGGGSFACPPGSLIEIDRQGEDEWVLALWLGQNDGRGNLATTTTTNVAAAISANSLKCLRPRYLVIGVTPKGDGTDNIGTTARTQLDAYNTAQAATYGASFVNPVPYLTSLQALTDAGITPTSQDNTDIANGVIPSSLRFDDTHLNDAGYTVFVNHVLVPAINALGWFN